MLLILELDWASRPAKASSNKIKYGPEQSALSIQTFFFVPHYNSPIGLSIQTSPSSAARMFDQFSINCAPRSRIIISINSLPNRKSGKSDGNGTRIISLFEFVHFTPFKVISPLFLEKCQFTMACKSVDFPAPFAPISETH